MSELARLLVEIEGDIHYERQENHLFFHVGDRVLVSRMIEAQFPAFERVVPKGNDKFVEFERERLTNALKRVALLSPERSRAVKFSIEEGKVEVSSSSPEFGEAKEVIQVEEYKGPALQIGFNGQYVPAVPRRRGNRQGGARAEGRSEPGCDEARWAGGLRLHLRADADAFLGEPGEGSGIRNRGSGVRASSVPDPRIPIPDP